MKNLYKSLKFIIFFSLFSLINIGLLSAHATFEKKEVESGSFQRLAIGIGHGCESAPTTRVRVIIPEGVISVKPQPKLGWNLSTKIGVYKTPANLHGREIKEGVQEVIWEGGHLEDRFFDEFKMSVKLPDNPGKQIYFKTIQECTEGANHWVEIPESGSMAHLEKPAPGLRLIPSHKGGHEMTQNQSQMMIKNAWVRAVPPTSKVTAGYLVLHNMSDHHDFLVGASANFANNVETHNVKEKDGVKEMFPVEKIMIPAKGQVELKPGGFHLMFTNLNHVPKVGDSMMVELNFAKAGKQKIHFQVQEGMKMEEMDHSKH